MSVSISKIEDLTEEYGGQWGIDHTKRLLKIISIIDEGLTYDREAVTLAAYLHDWGAYPKWIEPGVDHAIRSRQVGEEFLIENGCEKDLMGLVLECIEYHHSATLNNSIEAILLSDADALDFLGAVGTLRDFSKNPKDLRKANETVKDRRNKLQKRLLLEKTREIASNRINFMDQLLRVFEEETFGYF
jgi:uncharacterized protein